MGIVVIGAACGGTKFNRPTAASAPKPTVPVPSSVVVHDAALQAKVVGSVALTSAAHSACTSISVTLTGLGEHVASTGGFDVAGSGVVDFGSGDAKLGLSIPRLDRLGGGGSAIEQRVVDGVAYSKMPQEIRRSAGVPAAIRWFSLDPQHVAGAGATALSQSEVDPAGQLSFLAAASTDVRTIGSEKVRGIATTHYAATIDLAAPAGAAPGTRTAALRQRLVQLGAAIDGHRLALDVWLDQAGRVRRVVLSVPLKSRSTAGSLKGLGPDAMLRIQADFYAFGTPVVVAAPPHSEVRPYTMLRLDSRTG